MTEPKRLKEIKKEAFDEGHNDTLLDDILSEHALLFLDTIEDELSDDERDEVIASYVKGFRHGL